MQRGGFFSVFIIWSFLSLHGLVGETKAQTGIVTSPSSQAAREQFVEKFRPEIPLDRQGELLADLRRWARAGDSESQFMLGVVLKKHGADAQSRQESTSWLARAGEQEHPEARVELALSIIAGLVQAPTSSFARSLLENSRSHTGRAQLALGIMALERARTVTGSALLRDSAYTYAVRLFDQAGNGSDQTLKPISVDFIRRAQQEKAAAERADRDMMIAIIAGVAAAVILAPRSRGASSSQSGYRGPDPCAQARMWVQADRSYAPVVGLFGCNPYW